jgi:epoxyqueuosine reductase
LIKKRAAELGIDGIGICGAGPLEETGVSIREAVRTGLIPPDEAPGERALARMATPTLHLKSARSIISAYQAYPARRPTGIGPMHGVIAPYTRANYYGDLKTRLQGLSAFIGERFGAKTKAFSCYVTLAEKPLARKAGLGFYGKNGVIITPRHGSCVVLGEILTDLELDPDPPLETGCGDCRICMDACPSGAIPEPHRLNRDRCIQFLSGRRRTVPLDIREMWEDRLYGCSTCQDVCPHNMDRIPVEREVALGRVGETLAIEDALTMDDGRFEARFRDNQIGRREPAILKRNAILAAAHSGAEDLLAPIVGLTRDPDSMIRRHALWAAWKMLGPASAAVLRMALAAERDPGIVAEIKTLLDG